MIGQGCVVVAAAALTWTPIDAGKRERRLEREGVGPAVNVASWRRRRAPRARARKLRHCEQLHGILLNGSLLRAPAEDKTVRRWRLSNWIVKKKS